MRSRFLTYLAHTELRWKSEQEREELADFAEQCLPTLARLACKDCQDGELYNHVEADFWDGLNSDILPQSTPAESAMMVRTMEALKYWRGFLASKYPKMTHKEFEKKLAQERKRASNSTSTPQTSPTDDPETEGRLIERLSKERQRSARLRRRVIDIFGAKCTVCGLDMNRVYGDGADSYVEVHHLNPISNLDEEHEVTDETIRDEAVGLRPLCPNCHTMIHKLGDNWKTPMPLADFITLYRNING